MKSTNETANVVNAATTEPTVKSVDLAAAVAKQNAAKLAKKAVKPAAKSVAKKATKPVAKKAVKPVAKKAAKPVAKKAAKTAEPVTERKTSLFSLMAKVKVEDLGEGQRAAIAKLLKKHGSATRAQLIEALPDVSPANISWHLSMMVAAGTAKKVAQK
jgi:predicted ArsR family transcriptional regulator